MMGNSRPKTVVCGSPNSRASILHRPGATHMPHCAFPAQQVKGPLLESSSVSVEPHFGKNMSAIVVRHEIGLKHTTAAVVFAIAF